jgi:lysophospholipase L1-like esterase
MNLSRIFIFSALSGIGCSSLAAPAVTAFVYQGCLKDQTGSPVSGGYDFQMTLTDAAILGNQIGPVVTNAAVGVSNGLFTLILDFGADSFDGSARWLEIGVRTNAVGEFITLSLRQPVTPTPYALVSLSANGVAGTNVSGLLPAASLPLDPGTNVTLMTNGGRLRISAAGPIPITAGANVAIVTNASGQLQVSALTGLLPLASLPIDAGTNVALSTNGGMLEISAAGAIPIDAGENVTIVTNDAGHLEISALMGLLPIASLPLDAGTNVTFATNGATLQISAAGAAPLDAGTNIVIVTNANGHLQISAQTAGPAISLTNPVFFGDATYQADIVSTTPVGVGGASGNYPPAGLVIHLMDPLGRPEVTVLRSAYHYYYNGLATLAGVEPTGGACAMPTAFDFSIQADSFTFGTSTQPYVLNVDGVSTGTMPANTNWWLQVQFPDYRWRHIQITSELLFGIGLYSTNGFLGGPMVKMRRLIILGDSISEDPGVYGLGSGYGSQVMLMYQNLDVWSSGSGGTGYAVSTSTRPNFVSRVTPDVITNNPDYVLIMGGFNDGADHYPGGTNYVGASNILYAAASEVYSMIQTNLPSCKLIVCNMYSPHSPMNIIQQWSLGAITNACAAQGVTNIIDMVSDPWFTGTGNAANPQGDGNADVYISGDNVHPTVAGQYYLARRIAANLARMIPELIPNPKAQ